MKHLWEHYRELLGDGIIILFGLGSVYIFYKILTQGYAAFNEPNVPLAIFEFIVAVAIIGFGCNRMRKDLKRRKEK